MLNRTTMKHYSRWPFLLRDCLHGDLKLQVDEVTRSGGVNNPRLHSINLVTPVFRCALSDWSLARKQKQKKIIIKNKQTNKKRAEELFLRLMFFCSRLLHLLQPFGPVAVYFHF